MRLEILIEEHKEDDVHYFTDASFAVLAYSLSLGEKKYFSSMAVSSQASR